MNTWYYLAFIFVIIFLLVYLPKKKRRRFYVEKNIKKAKPKSIVIKEKEIMQELAKRFIGKDSIINLLEGTVDGVIMEVTEGGIVVEKNGKQQVVNLDYVMRIREYPYKKGKRATFVGD